MTTNLTATPSKAAAECDVLWREQSTFRLDETQLLRISSTCEEMVRGDLEPDQVSIEIEATTEDGTTVNFATVEQVFDFDNGGRHTLLSLSLSYETMAPDPDPDPEPGKSTLQSQRPPERVARVHFLSGDRSPLGRTAPVILLRVRGTSRDWTLRAADELKERLGRVTSYNRLVRQLHRSATRFAISLAFVVAGFAWSMAAVLSSASNERLVGQLGRLAKANPDATISQVVAIYERAKPDVPLTQMFIAFGLMGLGLIWMIGGFDRVIRWSYPPAVFYWGERQAATDRIERIRTNVLWVVVVGAAVSIVTGLILTLGGQGT